MTHKISVVIPTWNRALNVVKAVNSALSQTYPVFEVIVCDDGSTDNTREEINKLNDNRIKYIFNKGAGRPAVPRNLGIKKSTGDWIAFLDDDDEWLPEKIEKQLNAALELNSKAVCCNAFKRKGSKIDEDHYTAFSEQRITFYNLVYSNYVVCSSALLHRSLLEKTGGFPEEENLKALEDYTLWLRTATQTDFVFLPQPLLIYNDNPAGSIRVKWEDTFNQRKKIFENLLLWSRSNEAIVAKEYMEIFKAENERAEKMLNQGFFKKLFSRL